MDEFEETFADWLTQTVQVQAHLGPGAQGPVLGAPHAVPGVMVKFGNRLVRGTDAEERVSDASLVMPLRLSHEFPPESLVTLPDGQKRTVLARAVDAADLPLAHCRVTLV